MDARKEENKDRKSVPVENNGLEGTAITKSDDHIHQKSLNSTSNDKSSTPDQERGSAERAADERAASERIRGDAGGKRADSPTIGKARSVKEEELEDMIGTLKGELETVVGERNFFKKKADSLSALLINRRAKEGNALFKDAIEGRQKEMNKDGEELWKAQEISELNRIIEGLRKDKQETWDSLSLYKQMLQQHMKKMKSDFVVPILGVGGKKLERVQLYEQINALNYLNDWMGKENNDKEAALRGMKAANNLLNERLDSVEKMLIELQAGTATPKELKNRVLSTKPPLLFDN